MIMVKLCDTVFMNGVFKSVRYYWITWRRLVQRSDHFRVTLDLGTSEATELSFLFLVLLMGLELLGAKLGRKLHHSALNILDISNLHRDFC